MTEVCDKRRAAIQVTQQGKKKNIYPAYPTKNDVVPSLSSLHFTERLIPGLTITTAFAIWLAITTLLIPTLIQKYYYCNNSSSGNVIKINNISLGHGCTLLLPPINGLGWSILLFNNLNVLIAFCEIALGKHIEFIREDYHNLLKEYRDERTGDPIKAEYLAGIAYLNTPLCLRDIYDGGKKWSRMWSTYSLWDPSYSNPESFGFFIDVGNGWSTILPCWLWNFAILFPQEFTPLPPSSSSSLYQENGNSHSPTPVVLLGFIGACTYWQILYGTIIYFISFVWNKRYKNKSFAEVLGFVGFANGIWFFFPIACLWASYKLLLDRDPISVFWY